MKAYYDNRPIGVFDSGIGGLTVLKELLEKISGENFIYVGDTKNLPYGEKNKEELILIIKRIFDFFKSLNVKAVVMACNTSSAQVYDELKNLYDFKIYPIIQITSECITKNKNLKRIAVLATNATINSHAYAISAKSHNKNIEIYEHSCPEWVPIVEKTLDNFNEDDLILKYLKPALDFKPDTIILGCTHYPYLLDKLKKYAPLSLFCNPAVPFANYIVNDIEKANTTGSCEFYTTSNPEKFKKNASIFLNIDSEVKLLSI